MAAQYVGHNPTENHSKVFESREIKRLDQVDVIKSRAAFLLAEIDSISIPPENREAGRLVSLAKTELESCVMWAVKALSRNHE